MKKLIVIMLMIGIWIPALAQQSQSLFEKLTDKYAEKDGFSASMLTSDMFDLYMKKKNVDESSEVADALKTLDNILVVSQSNLAVNAQWVSGFYNQEEKKEKSPKNEEEDNVGLIHKEMLNYYKTNGYTLLKTEKRMGEDVKVYLKKNQERITALALITNSSVSTNLVELQGDDIDLANVASLSKTMNLRGLENLYKLDNSNSAFYGRSLPSGHMNWSDEQVEEMKARALEMAEQHKLSDEQIKEIEKQAQFQAQKQAEMAEKYREMAERYGRQPIFLTTPGDTNTVYYIDGKEVKGDKVKQMLQEGGVEQIKKTEKDGKTVIEIKTK